MASLTSTPICLLLILLAGSLLGTPEGRGIGKNHPKLYYSLCVWGGRSVVEKFVKVPFLGTEEHIFGYTWSLSLRMVKLLMGTETLTPNGDGAPSSSSSNCTQRIFSAPKD